MKFPLPRPVWALRILLAAAGLGVVTGAYAIRGQNQGQTDDRVAPPPPTEVTIVVTQEGGRKIPMAIPVPIAPLDAAVQNQIAVPFHKTLSADLSTHQAFLLADPLLFPKAARPPANREQGDLWVAAGAQYLLDTQVQVYGDQVTVIAQVYDVRTLTTVLSRRYEASTKALRSMAHRVANDVVKQFTGKPGPFTTKIVFTSDRDSSKGREVYIMDFDGENQTRLTYHKSLSNAPDMTADGKRVVYQSYYTKPSGAITNGLFFISQEGGAPKQIPLPTGLNASPSISPDGKTIAFCGSVQGNPEIFTVEFDGSGLKRLTDATSIDSTPRWTPNGREIAFTSNRQGSPQIYLMDTDGANIRRVTMAGKWSDEANFSPRGDLMAYSCRNEGEFQICVNDLASGRTFQITDLPGSHENPAWSPDGTRIAWQRRFNGSTQIVTANPDGSSLKILTTIGNNYGPVWSKSLE